MLKKVKILFLSLLFNTFACSPVHPKAKCINSIDPPVKSYVKIFTRVIIKECTKEKKKDTNCPVGQYVSSGSGINIKLLNGTATVLTAGHVCNMPIHPKVTKFSRSVEVEDINGSIHQAWVILSSLTNSKGSPDMCVLWVPSLEGPSVQFSKKAPKAGDFVYYIGSPAGVFHPPTAPIFSGHYSGNVDASTSMSSVPAMGGSSGSSLLSNEGKVIGVIWAVHPKFHHVTLSSSYKASKSFLDAAKKKLKDMQIITN